MTEERKCGTCEHAYKPGFAEPCRRCSVTTVVGEPYSLWEAPAAPGGASHEDAPLDAPVDATNPAHYRQFPVEVIQLVRHLNFNRGNAVKYLCRAGKKDDEIQDLRKAKWYVEDELQRLTGEGEHAKP